MKIERELAKPKIYLKAVVKMQMAVRKPVISCHAFQSE